MSYHLAWLVENRVILCTITDNLTLNELNLLTQSIIDNLDHGIAPVHVLVDVRDMQDFPRNLIQIRDIVQPALKRPTMGWEILVGHQNPIVRFLASVITHMSDVKLHMVDTPEEGLAFLATVDSSLANHNEA